MINLTQIIDLQIYTNILVVFLLDYSYSRIIDILIQHIESYKKRRRVKMIQKLCRTIFTGDINKQAIIPLHRASCQGCVTVSTRGMDYLWDLVNREKKPLLLWNYMSKQQSISEVHPITTLAMWENTDELLSIDEKNGARRLRRFKIK